MKKEMQKICFIVNPISGANRKPQKIVHWIEEVFRASGQQVEIRYTRERRDAIRLAREAADQNFDMVVAVGGDGTINEIGRSLVHSQVVLGIVPAGSGNGFARNFHIPLDQYKAIQLLRNPTVRAIDVGRLNRHYFFNVAGMGLDAEISRRFEDFGQRGPLPYFLIGTRAFMQYQPEQVTLHFENQSIEFSPLLLSIANAPQYGNGAVIAPAAKPDDQLLDVIVLDPMPIWKAAPNIYRLFNGTIDQVEEFHSFQVKKVVIERAAPGSIHTDGDPYREAAELEIEAIPSALLVAVENSQA